MTHHRTTVGAGLLVALVGAIGFATSVAWRSGPTRREPASTVALVEGQAITADDLDLRLSEILPMASYHGRIEPARLVSLKRAALDELVLDELIYREAVAHGQHPASDAVDTEVSAARARFDSVDEFAAALRENGLDEAGFRARAGRSILVRAARAAHARLEVSAADIAAYYRDNGAKFQRPDQVHLLEILFRVDPADPTSRGPAERKARVVLARLRQGESFAVLARDLSEDEYRVKDGDMGLVHRGRLDREFEDAVFTAPLRQPALARSLYGVQVFEVVERQPAAQLTLDEAWPDIGVRLTRQRRSEDLRAWKAHLLAGSHVEIRDAALRGAQPAELAMDSAALGPGRGRWGATAGRR
ncbi:MAG TPA: peptidylprolyl isomerase [Vicinamibacterales bacterium]|jgi:parvulin-like peptidyl-prolyl isomerase